MGVYFTAIGAAMFCGPFLSSLLTLFMDLRRLFLVSTVFPLVALVFFFLAIQRQKIEEYSNVNESDLEMGGSVTESIIRIFQVKNVLGLCSARVAFALSMGVFSTVYPIYAEGGLGFTPSLISLLFTFRGITNVLIRLPAGRLSDRVGRRKPFSLAYSIVIVVFVLLALTENFTLLAVVMALYGVGWGMRIAPSTALLSESVTSEDRPLALAVFMTMFDVGSFIGALLAGFTTYFLYPTMLILSCVPILIAAVLIFLFLSTEIKN
jgi:MFS family permease